MTYTSSKVIELGSTAFRQPNADSHCKYLHGYQLKAELTFGCEKLDNNKEMNEAFGQDVLKSYIKLRNSEIKEFNQKENFDKTKAITKWEKDNTLDC